MKTRFVFWTLGLLAVIAVSACVPTATTAPANPAATTAPANPAEAAAPTLPPPSPTAALHPTSTAEISAPDPTVQPVATSRGPHLEATDPTTVSLASGGLQLVEFFRFT